MEIKGGIQLLEKAVQAAIYEKALKNHYIEILYIDFEDTGKCIKLHQDTKLLSGENIFQQLLIWQRKMALFCGIEVSC